MSVKEIWKSVIGYEKSHQVSNLGRIRTVDRVEKLKRSNCTKKFSRIFYGQPLSNRVRKNGYCRAHMKLRGVNKELYFHRAVAMAFIKNPSSLPQVNHKNGNKLDNRVINLEWVTEKENMEHAVKLGLIKKRK